MIRWDKKYVLIHNGRWCVYSEKFTWKLQAPCKVSEQHICTMLGNNEMSFKISSHRYLMINKMMLCSSCGGNESFHCGWPPIVKRFQDHTLVLSMEKLLNSSQSIQSLGMHEEYYLMHALHSQEPYDVSILWHMNLSDHKVSRLKAAVAEGRFIHLITHFDNTFFILMHMHYAQKATSCWVMPFDGWSLWKRQLLMNFSMEYQLIWGSSFGGPYFFLPGV